MNLEQELTEWLDTLTITGDNIGEIRRSCFMPWDGKWNGIVRDKTAERERSPDAHKRIERWLPIDTAPKDGTNFLACSPASSVFLAHYANGVVDSSDWTDGDGYKERHATHWMPLPAPAST